MNFTARWMYWAAILLLVLPLSVGAASWLSPADQVGDQGGLTRTVDTRGNTGEVSVDSFAGRARRTAPFRPDGRPSGVAYDPTRSEMSAQGYAPPKPALTLNGILDGPSPLALIEGIPGHNGPAVLGVGETLAGFKVRRINDGAVTVTAMDTTWTLRIREQ